jgi:hypothetical protein
MSAIAAIADGGKGYSKFSYNNSALAAPKMRIEMYFPTACEGVNYR